MKRKFLTLILALISTAGIAGTTPDLRPGDLLFVASGESDFSRAIVASTQTDSGLEFVHVGMIAGRGEGGEGEWNVVEASPEAGVRTVSLSQFLDESPLIDGKPAVVAKRLTIEFPVAEAIDRALEHLGQPYDWYYLPDNVMTYCSELIYESYLDSDSNPIFETYPMNFRDADGNMPDFWTELFRGIGTEVPEGIPGTNPNRLSQDERLTAVWSFISDAAD